MPNYFFSLARCICQTIMAEETNQPQKTESRPDATQQPAESRQADPRAQQQSGQRRRHDHRDRAPSQGRHPGGQRHHFRRDHPPRPQQETPAETGAKPEDSDAGEDEKGHDRSSQPRRHHRGGRPPRKIVEEWASDIYCE
ncbi:MAG: hypothetical protein CW742_09535 [Methanoregula sp.]|nr:MAG: hypothetical protein CW742_09535 [Methanoregula sp.]